MTMMRAPCSIERKTNVIPHFAFSKVLKGKVMLK